MSTDRSRSGSFYFDKLHDLFYSPTVYKKAKDESGKSKMTLDNAVQSAYISPGLCVHVGDNIILRNGKIAVLETIITEAGKTFPYLIHYVCDGKILKFRTTPRNIQLLKDAYARKTTLKEVPYGDRVLKVGDLIKFKSPTEFGEFATMIGSIRKTIDGYVEVGIPGYGNYRLDTLNLSGCEILDKDNFTFNGININKDGRYEYSSRPSQKPFSTTRPIKYCEMKHDDSGTIVVRFEDTNTHDKFNVPIGELKTRITEVNEKVVRRSIGSAFRFGNSLKRASVEAFSINGKLDTSGLRDYQDFSFRKGCVFDFTGKDKLFIPGVDFDLELHVGENVLVVDQENPLEMMNIKTITGFRASDDYRLFVELIDKNKNVSAVDIIFNNMIYPERFRRVTNKIGELSVGMKIVSKEPYIYLFPKKDTNIIVAFVIDQVPEPLVFLSNGLTLWLSDVQTKFTHIPMTSKKWKKLAHAPIINEFKLQPGDIISQQDPYMPEYVHCNNMKILSSYAAPDFSLLGTMNPWTLYSKKYIRGGRNVKLLGLPTPRYSTALTDTGLEFVSGFPTPYGIVPCSTSGFYYPVINGKLGG